MANDRESSMPARPPRSWWCRVFGHRFRVTSGSYSYLRDYCTRCGYDTRIRYRDEEARDH